MTPDPRIPPLPDLSTCRSDADVLDVAKPIDDVAVVATDGDIVVRYAFEGDVHSWTIDVTVGGTEVNVVGDLLPDGSACKATSVFGDELDPVGEDEVLDWANEHLTPRISQLWLSLGQEERLRSQRAWAAERARHYACEVWRAEHSRNHPVPLDHLREQLRLAHTRHTALLLDGPAGAIARHLTDVEFNGGPEKLLAAVDAATAVSPQ
jgi:hypothetical protein